MWIRCTKIEAAARQLDEAILLMFTGHDPLAVHTLAAAARGIFADLLDLSKPGKSSRSLLIAASTEHLGLSRKTAIEVHHWIQNYLKHADRDPEAELSFTEEQNDHLIFGSIMDCGLLGHAFTSRMKVFQTWYLACHPETLGEDSENVRRVHSYFPGMHEKTREEQVAWGEKMLQAAELVQRAAEEGESIQPTDAA